MRPLTLHESAVSANVLRPWVSERTIRIRVDRQLTPLEHKTYLDYFRAIGDSTGDVIHTSSVSRQAFRSFVLDRLRVPSVTADSILQLFGASEHLSAGQVFALLRLLAHEQRSATPVDLNMTFLPGKLTPAILAAAASSCSSTAASTQRRQTGPIHFPSIVVTALA
jgi:hypothetical protein